MSHPLIRAKKKKIATGEHAKELEIIRKYNNLVDSIDKSKPSPDILRKFGKDQWLWFIAGKTLASGRLPSKSISNAEANLRMYDKEKLIKLWAYEKIDALQGHTGFGQTQAELFRAKRELVLTPEDIATASDPLYICLQRMGGKLKRVQEIQASIADKMTPDLFTGKKGRLTGGEKMFQEQIDECFKRIAAGRRTGKPQQLKLLGADYPLREQIRSKYAKVRDDITKLDVYTLHGLLDSMDLYAKIFAETKTEYGKRVKRYFPQINDDYKEAVLQIEAAHGPGFRSLKNAKKALEEELAKYLKGDGAWASKDINPLRLYVQPGERASGVGAKVGDSVEFTDGRGWSRFGPISNIIEGQVYVIPGGAIKPVAAASIQRLIPQRGPSQGKAKQMRLFGLSQVQQEFTLPMRAPQAGDPIPDELDSLALIAKRFPPTDYMTDPIVNRLREAYREIHPFMRLPISVKGKYPKPLENILAYEYGYASGDPKRSIQAFWYHVHGYAPDGGELPEEHKYPWALEGGGYADRLISP